MQPAKVKEIDAYCELRFEAQVFRTPCVRGSGRPSWNWQFDIQLPEPTEGRGPCSEGELRRGLVSPDWHWRWKLNVQLPKPTLSGAWQQFLL